MQDPHLSQKTFSQAHHPTKTREINGTETPHTINTRVSADRVKYDVVTDYGKLMDLVR